MRALDRKLRVLLAFMAVGALACGEPPPEFDDHTVPRILSAEHFASLAEVGPSRSITKFTITQFSQAEARAPLYMDSSFYKLHDEWYWFRLLNGQPIPGDVEEPPTGFRFGTIEEVYDWAREEEDDLPLDLRWVTDGERLYSPRFYKLALDLDQRLLGVGGIVYIPRNDLWLFQLEYVDKVTYDELVVFFETLVASLPPEIAYRLKWVVRSPDQEMLALRMEEEELLYHDRIVRYADLVVPGETEIYNSGLTAGRLKLIASGESLQGTRPDDILVLEDVPDWLPPAGGLITGLPQTPLAHINVLAKNRGIPNAYLGGAMNDPQILQLAPVRAPVVYRAAAPERLELVGITNEEYTRWSELRSEDGPPLAYVPRVDLSTAPYTLELSTRELSEVDALRPLIGGKAAGFLALLEAGVTTPDRPLAITIRPYVEHLGTIYPAINAMLRAPEFKAKVQIRYLVLEGPERYAARFTSPRDQALGQAFVAGHPLGDPVGDLVRAGGLARAIREKLMRAETVSRLHQALSEHFFDYAATQGLRFRSSSTVEDIEGFNGAGLYDSNTGFLSPEAQAAENERKKSIEWAIKKTWSSYWRFEAFEERSLERIDHLSGSMAVLVHARFDDPKEVTNGVFTLTLLPENLGDQATMELNVQAGAVSVTNPDPESEDLPEVDRVTLSALGQSEIIRVRPSTLAETGTALLSDDELLQIFAQATEVASLWLEESNHNLPEAQASRTVTLDFEFREMAEGWPLLESGPAFAQRIVLKQARSLDPGLRRMNRSALSLPIPRDILGRARRVERRTCSVGPARLVVSEALTDPLADPDLGYASVAFTGGLGVEFIEDAPELDKAAGARFEVDHLDFEVREHSESGTTWHLSIQLEAAPAELVGVQTIEIESGVEFRMVGPAGEIQGGLEECELELLHSTPEDYLMSLLENAGSAG